VTVCPDTPDEIRTGRRKHGLEAEMLSDPDLALAREFNLINPRNMTPKGLGKPLPIPTTFLVDATGVVRWVDQTDDYMLRSQPEHVLAAIQSNLG
jgi:peroxiredoxin